MICTGSTVLALAGSDTGQRARKTWLTPPARRECQAATTSSPITPNALDMKSSAAAGATGTSAVLGSSPRSSALIASRRLVSGRFSPRRYTSGLTPSTSSISVLGGTRRLRARRSASVPAPIAGVPANRVSRASGR